MPLYLPSNDPPSSVTDEEALKECRHTPHIPEFDEARSRWLSVGDIRHLWPCFVGVCSVCGKHVTCYASYLHMLAGDW